ncbi:hypothetical protein [Burkholderia diffusa]|uniref:hypothetical protein n=1 Tax=Burkholderia diffusa TaxID=488732 RepID=UPI00157A8FBD|nr:hypothetical protein [Burkholderia diffusa]NTY37500.1 hypothetical protein [Burkholderia diffusa]
MDIAQISSPANQHSVTQGRGRKLIVATFDQRYQVLPSDERTAVQVVSFVDEQLIWILVLSGQPAQVAISPTWT